MIANASSASACGVGVSDGRPEPMSFAANPAPVPDRDSLPLKKRDQRPNSPGRHLEVDGATFKAPYPYKSHVETKPKHSSPFQPVPRRVPALYQPWTHTTSRPKPHVLSAFREHHGWTEWRDLSTMHLPWDLHHPYQHHNHLPGTPALHPHPHHPSRFTLLSEGFQRPGGGYGWEQLRTLRESLERQSNGRSKGPYGRRKDRKVELLPRVEKAGPPSQSTFLPQAANKDLALQQEPSRKAAKVVKPSAPGPSSLRVSSSDTSTSVKKEQSRSLNLPSSSEKTSSSSSSSSSPNHFPWLLPHFVAGSLIELRDGRLRRVEHLQTEDFLLGSLACPDLCLSCCTVQSISPSASSSSVSRLLILLHNQQSQELVDVYVEYPFFVRGRGWSSCSPHRTARLCGLQCRQLSVGDVCLALTPVAAPQPLPAAALEPKTSPGGGETEGGCGSLKATPQQQPPPLGPAERGQKKEVEVEVEGVRRRRHCSAPELRGPGTNCM